MRCLGAVGCCWALRSCPPSRRSAATRTSTRAEEPSPSATEPPEVRTTHHHQHTQHHPPHPVPHISPMTIHRRSNTCGPTLAHRSFLLSSVLRVQVALCSTPPSSLGCPSSRRTSPAFRSVLSHTQPHSAHHLIAHQALRDADGRDREGSPLLLFVLPTFVYLSAEGLCRAQHPSPRS